MSLNGFVSNNNNVDIAHEMAATTVSVHVQLVHRAGFRCAMRVFPGLLVCVDRLSLSHFLYIFDSR